MRSVSLQRRPGERAQGTGEGCDEWISFEVLDGSAECGIDAGICGRRDAWAGNLGQRGRRGDGHHRGGDSGSDGDDCEPCERLHADRDQRCERQVPVLQSAVRPLYVDREDERLSGREQGGAGELGNSGEHDRSFGGWRDGYDDHGRSTGRSGGERLDRAHGHRPVDHGPAAGGERVERVEFDYYAGVAGHLGGLQRADAWVGRPCGEFVLDRWTAHNGPAEQGVFQPGAVGSRWR
jgi:hypothetical protein